MDKNRISPDLITQLKEGEVFVFGSNAQGLHFGGAARVAVNRFGALMGQGEGLQGQSYAIPTMEGPESMKQAVERFCAFAQEHPELTFLVTAIGCGIAGFCSAGFTSGLLAFAGSMTGFSPAIAGGSKGLLSGFLAVFVGSAFANSGGFFVSFFFAGFVSFLTVADLGFDVCGGFHERHPI